MLTIEPATGAVVKFDPIMITSLLASGDAGAHEAWKPGRVGPVRV
jgi:hypothetical protein